MFEAVARIGRCARAVQQLGVLQLCQRYS
jgi:hypothetical protein